jgi:hypothetical protein
MSLLVASDGTDAAPGTVTVTWPIRTPRRGPVRSSSSAAFCSSPVSSCICSPCVTRAVRAVRAARARRSPSPNRSTSPVRIRASSVRRRPGDD